MPFANAVPIALTVEIMAPPKLENPELTSPTKLEREPYVADRTVPRSVSKSEITVLTSDTTPFKPELTEVIHVSNAPLILAVSVVRAVLISVLKELI